MMRMFLTMIRVLLKCEKDFLTTLQEFVYNKHKILCPYLTCTVLSMFPRLTMFILYVPMLSRTAADAKQEIEKVSRH